MKYRLSQHALEEVQRRGMSIEQIESVLEHPHQIVSEQAGRKAYQSKLDFGTGKTYLLRVIVDEDVEPAVVVTA
jgi:hypothetical protein